MKPLFVLFYCLIPYHLSAQEKNDPSPNVPVMGSIDNQFEADYSFPISFVDQTKYFKKNPKEIEMRYELGKSTPENFDWTGSDPNNSTNLVNLLFVMKDRRDFNPFIIEGNSNSYEKLNRDVFFGAINVAMEGGLVDAGYLSEEEFGTFIEELSENIWKFKNEVEDEKRMIQVKFHLPYRKPNGGPFNKAKFQFFDLYVLPYTDQSNNEYVRLIGGWVLAGLQKRYSLASVGFSIEQTTKLGSDKNYKKSGRYDEERNGFYGYWCDCTLKQLQKNDGIIDINVTDNKIENSFSDFVDNNNVTCEDL
jgi:hypothetical protein